MQQQLGTQLPKCSSKPPLRLWSNLVETLEQVSMAPSWVFPYLRGQVCNQRERAMQDLLQRWSLLNPSGLSAECQGDTCLSFEGGERAGAA